MSSIPSPMATGRLNALRWDGQPGHYEVWYLSLTDRASGCGVWIRYTMVAPSDGRQATASLWLMAMEPDGDGAPIGRKATWPADALTARAEPFELRIADAVLTAGGAEGAFEDVAWSLSWAPDPHPAEHVHPLLQRARVAKTVLVLPQPDLAISGSVRWGDRELALDGARGGQAHIWGSKHANRWAWVHCNDLETVAGEPRRGDYVDGVSVFVPRFGRELGPNTPVVGRFAGEEFRSTNPVRVNGNPSTFALSSWDFEARDGNRRIAVDVDAPREDARGRHLQRPRRGAGLLLQQRGGLAALPRLPARPGRAHRLAPGRDARRPRPRPLRVRAARARPGLELQVR